MRSVNLKKNNLIFLILLFIFAFYFTVYCVLNIFSKAARSDCDMVLYYQMAYSIFRGEGIKHFGVDCNYISVMYPLLMSPFFAIGNPVVRVQAISILNAFLVSSCVIPLFLISKKILKSKKLALVFCFLSMMLPFAAEAIDFGMCEPLYYPLIMWLFYLFLINIKRQNYLISGLGALLTEITFLCKYITLCLYVSIVLLPLLIYIIKKFNDSNITFKNIFTKKILINYLIYTFGFALLFFVFKYAIFHKYEPMVNYFKIISWERLGYFFYGLINILAAMAMTTFILPVIIPWFFIKKMNKQQKYLYGTLILFFVINAIVISSLIYVVEDYGRIDPRDLARYYMGTSPLLILYIFLILENKNWLTKDNKKQINKAVIIGLIIFCLIFKGTGQDRKDSEGFFFYGYIELILEKSGITGLPMFLVIFAINVVLSLLIYLFFVLLINDKKIIIGKKNFKNQICFVCAVAFFLPSTVIGIKDYRNNTSISAQEISAVKNIDSFINDNSDSTFLILTRNAISVGIYGEYHENELVCVSPQFISDMNKLHKEKLLVSDYEFLTPRYNYKYPQVYKIDYIFIHNRVKFESFNLIGITEQTFEGNDLWHLFKNDDSTNLMFKFID